MTARPPAEGMLLIGLVIVWSVLLELSPGIALVVTALGAIALDRYGAGVLDALVTRTQGSGATKSPSRQ